MITMRARLLSLLMFALGIAVMFAGAVYAVSTKTGGRPFHIGHDDLVSVAGSYDPVSAAGIVAVLVSFVLAMLFSIIGLECWPRRYHPRPAI